MRRVGEKMLPRRLRQSLDIGFRRSIDASRVAPASSEASSGDRSPSKLSGDDSNSDEARDTFVIPDVKKDAKNTMLATVNLEKERLQKQCKNLESTAEELRNQNQRLAADKEQLQAIAGAHEQEIRRLKSDNATLEKSVTKLKREIQSINKLKQSVQEQLADLKAQLQSTQAEIQADKQKKANKVGRAGWVFVASGAVSVAIGAAVGIMRHKGIRLEFHTN